MKRLIGIAAILMLAGISLSQTFTIRRPADGAVVREVVSIRIPKNSIPENGYVGMWVNGKFLEAAVPDLVGSDYVYKLDTKAHGLPDGKINLEAVLYVDYAQGPKIAARSSVDIIIDNTTSIKVPTVGRKLRYKFIPGTELVYDVDNKVAVSSISSSLNALGSRPAELPLDSEKFRIMYAIENVYHTSQGTEGLVRMQALPKKGKDYAILTLNNDTEPKRYSVSDMAPIYMRMTDTGREVFSSAPLYMPMEGSAGQGNTFDLWAVIPWPVLPTKPVKQGSTWQAPFQNGVIDTANMFESDKFTYSFPARGELKGFEWEMGIPTAKLENKIEVGTASQEGKQLQNLGRAFADDKIQLSETIWFALDRGVAIKVLRDITIDRKLDQNTPGGPGSGAPMGGPENGGPARGGRGKLSGGGGGMGAGGGDFEFRQQMGGGLGKGGGRAAGGGGQGRFGGGRNAGASAPTAQYVRIHVQQILTLEK